MIKFFKGKYDAGYNKGWEEGFEVGRKKAIAEQRKVIIAAIQKDIDKNKAHYTPGVLSGITKAIEIVRKHR
jgi:flagellar biosynthesis/type III secretory pathway protein FliH